MNLRRFPFEHQLDAKDCGPACLNPTSTLIVYNYTEN